MAELSTRRTNIFLPTANLNACSLRIPSGLTAWPLLGIGFESHMHRNFRFLFRYKINILAVPSCELNLSRFLDNFVSFELNCFLHFSSPVGMPHRPCRESPLKARAIEQSPSESALSTRSS